MNRIYNFSAGPATLPLSVLEAAQKDLVDYQGQGLSVMEMSHRSPAFDAIIQAAEANLRKLLDIPANYQVLFLQGGATQVFSTLVMNLRQSGKMAYVDSGNFAKKAYQAALELADTLDLEVDLVASSKDQAYQELPALPADLDADYDFIHICTNNTIEGTQFTQYPQYEGVPLVADMSSDFLSAPIDMTQFGMIYAGAQKNAGIAGLTIVIIRDDLLERSAGVPAIFNYQTLAKAGSMYNTPSTYPIYINRLLTDWLLAEGGLEQVAENNQAKAHILYEAITASDLFQSNVAVEDRSVMNIPFTTGDADLDQAFIQATVDAGMTNLKGHRSVGGMRASIYNAFPVEGIEALAELMKKFERENQ